MTVELLYLPNCPHHCATSDLVRDVLKDEGITAEFTETAISDYAEAKEHGFPGSPTVRVNGRDIENLSPDDLTVGFACRTYLVDGKPQGVPPRAWLESAIRAVHTPQEKHPSLRIFPKSRLRIP